MRTRRVLLGLLGAVLFGPALVKRLVNGPSDERVAGVSPASSPAVRAEIPPQPPQDGGVRLADFAHRFEAEMSSRGMSFERISDGGASSGSGGGYYRVTRDGGGERFVYSGNLELDFKRDHDVQAIGAFVDRIFKPSESRPWSEARAFVYFAAQPNDFKFGETIRSTVSPRVERIVAVTDAEERTITWVNEKTLKSWGVTRAEAEQVAGDNLDRLLRTTTLQVDLVGGMKLGMVPLNSVFKASVIFAPGFRKYVEPQLGWPVFAATPCRDFIYVLANNDIALLNSLGPVVLKEYSTSGYPITTEVWRISDAGLETVGELRAPPTSSQSR